MKNSQKELEVPETVQWLLDFVNLGSKPGVYNASKNKDLENIKRPPITPPTNLKVPEIYPAFQDIDPRYIDDGEGNIWFLSKEGETPILSRAKDDIPSEEEFIRFLKKTDVKEDQESTNGCKLLWYAARSAIICKLSDDIISEDDRPYHDGGAAWSVSYVYKYKKIPLPERHKLSKYLEFPHDNKFGQVTCSRILDFWHNHKELHRFLKYCECCGKIWPEDATISYCGDECRNRFNIPSLSVSNETQKRRRENLRQKKRKSEKPKIIDFILEASGCQKDEAEEIYDQSSRRSKTSLKEFKRTRGKKLGLS